MGISAQTFRHLLKPGFAFAKDSRLPTLQSTLPLWPGMYLRESQGCIAPRMKCLWGKDGELIARDLTGFTAIPISEQPVRNCCPNLELFG